MNKVLLVDDSYSARMLFEKFMAARPDVACRTVGDPEKALAEAQDFQPDIIVLDYKFDTTNGVELGNYMARSGIKGKYYLLTACEIDKVSSTPRHFEVTSVIQKPITPEIIEAILAGK